MTRKEFCPYVRRLADLMGLRDWAFSIPRAQPEDDNAVAAIFCSYGRKHGEIRLSDEFLEDHTPEEKRQTLCHELTHAQFAPMHQFLRDTLDPQSFKAYLLLYEYGVDAVADAIAPRMPLPPAPTQ